MSSAEESAAAARWTVFGERTLYDSPWVQLVKVDVQPPVGARFEHHVVRLQRVALAVVIDSEQRVLMLRHHRFVTDEFGWELPGGIVEQGEEPAAAAAREVEEETGWRPADLEALLSFQPMVGMVDTPHDVFLARTVRHIGQPTDLEAGGQVAWIALDSIPELIAKGEVAGAGSLIGLLYYLNQQQRG